MPADAGFPRAKAAVLEDRIKGTPSIFSDSKVVFHGWQFYKLQRKEKLTLMNFITIIPYKTMHLT
jgi:hypothetical protein